MGNSLEVSQSKTIEELVKTNKANFSEVTDILEMLQKPRHALSIEILKALKKISSKIIPVFTNRCTTEEEKNLNSTAIRSVIYKKNKVKKAKKLLPSFSYNLLKEEIKLYGVPNLQIYSDLCMYALKSADLDEIKRVYDISENIEERFFELARNYNTLEDFPHILVLAFKQDEKLLKNVSANTNLVFKNTPDNDINKKLAQLEDRANLIYYMLLNKNLPIPNYTPDLTKVIIEK